MYPFSNLFSPNTVGKYLSSLCCQSTHAPDSTIADETIADYHLVFKKHFNLTKNVFNLVEKSLHYDLFKDSKASLILGNTFSSFYEQVILKSGIVNTQFMYYEFSDKIRRTCVYFVSDYVSLSVILRSMGIVSIHPCDNDVVLYPELLGIVTILYDGRYTNVIMDSFFELNQTERKFRIISKDFVRNYYDLSKTSTMLSQLQNAHVDSRTIPFDELKVSKRNFLNFVKMPSHDFDTNIVSHSNLVTSAVQSLIDPSVGLIDSLVELSPELSSSVSSSLDVIPLNADYIRNFCGSDGFVYYCLQNLNRKTHANFYRIVFTFITRDVESIEDFIRRSSLVDEELSNLRDCLLKNNGDNLEIFLENPSFNKELLLDICQNKAFNEHSVKNVSKDSFNDCMKVFRNFIKINQDFSPILSIGNNAHLDSVIPDNKT